MMFCFLLLAQSTESFKLSDGFKIELVASEPDVVDPVAMAFDENGRIYVVEMPGYPSGSKPGRIKILGNRRVFASDLRAPTSVMPYKKGVLVADAPELLYLEDTDGDGKADVRRVLYTGFETKHIHALVNGLQWGLDNWVHGLGSLNGGEIRSGNSKVISLRGQNFRFKPDVPASLEPETGGGQYGLAEDDWGNWFTCHNSAHLRHAALPDLPYIFGPPAVIDIPDHGAAAKLFRASGLEPWRVERTKRRAAAQDSKRYAPTELVPGGFVTSACGLAINRADVFICDPANNLIHRDVLEPNGVTFVAKRADEGREFLTSTDNMFRPVFLTFGPDGALYICDFPREVIEGPQFIPEDIRGKLDFESKGLGRIWRISPVSAKSTATGPDVVRDLEHPNGWRRMTAQRLIVQYQRKELIPALEKVLESKNPIARLHALWTLDGLGQRRWTEALRDTDPGVREHAVRAAQAATPELLALAEDTSPRVRFQLAFTLARHMDAKALVTIANRDASDPYIRTAVLYAATGRELSFFLSLPAYHEDLARQIGARLNSAEIVGLLEAADQPALRGLANGLKLARKRNLDIPAARPALRRFLNDPSEAVRKAAAEVAGFIRTYTDEEIQAASAKALDPSKSDAERVDAALMLGTGHLSTLARLLEPRHSESVQLAAVQALDALADPAAAKILIENWRRLTPAVRDRAIEALLSRKDRMAALLRAIADGVIPADHIDSRRRAQLASFPELAKKVFEERSPDKELFDEFKPALDLKGDATRGAAHFRKLCLSCHVAGGEGVAIGPDLKSVRDNPPEQILMNLLYPSLSILPSYLQFIVETNDGQILNGVIVESKGASLTLRRQNAEDAHVLRKDIKNLVASKLSPMPEELLKGLSHQDVSDLLEFVKRGDLEYIEPDDASGTSKAVVVRGAALAHTTQIFSQDAKGALDELSAALREVGSDLDNAVRIHVYAARQDVVDQVKLAFSRRFAGRAKPAATFVVGALSRPDALVSMDAVAAAPSVQAVRLTPRASVLPLGPVVFVSGQASNGEIAEATRKTLASLKATLEHLGLTAAHVGQMKVFMRPIGDAQAVTKEIKSFFGAADLPPLVFVEWTLSTPIEIELVASVGAAKESIEFITPPGMKGSPVFSLVTRMDGKGLVFTSGLYGSGDADAQLKEVFASLRQILEKSGSDMRHMAKATYYISDNATSDALTKIRRELYDPERPPAASKALVRGVGVQGKTVTLDMIAAPRR